MNFLGMGSLEMLTVFIIAFLILGPQKMIGMGKEIGKFVRDARKYGSDLQNSITEGTDQPIKSLRSLVDLEVDLEETDVVDESGKSDVSENPTSLLDSVKSQEPDTGKRKDKGDLGGK